jgi:NSS family neurotransmitter:Na+ symporter
VIFPIIFSFAGLAPGQGPGLLFATIPTGMLQMPLASLLLTVFFVLLVFAALTSAISLLEVPVSWLIDERGWSRSKAALVAGAGITIYGLPSALSGDFLGGLDWVVSNLLFPIGGIGIALFTGWKMSEATRHDHFLSGSKFGIFYNGWLTLLRFVVPVGITIVLLNATGLLNF